MCFFLTFLILGHCGKETNTLQQQELFKRIDFAALTIIMKTREN